MVLTLIRNVDCPALRIFFFVPKVISSFVKVISSLAEMVRMVAEVVGVVLRVIEKRRGSTCSHGCFLFIDMDGVNGCL